MPSETVTLAAMLIAESAIDIRLVSHSLKMRRIGAGTCPAQMVDLSAFRNWPDEVFVGEPMSRGDFAVGSECPVAVCTN